MCFPWSCLLPREIDGCGALEGQLTPALLSRLRSAQMKSQRVELFLPRFKMASDFELQGHVRQDGHARRLRAEGRLLRHGWDAEPLLFPSVFHKAWVDVNEEGTEAAAATAVTMGTHGMPMNRRRLRPSSAPIIRSSSASATLVPAACCSWADSRTQPTDGRDVCLATCRNTSNLRGVLLRFNPRLPRSIRSGNVVPF